jgi:hypothetical protein
MRKLVSYAVLSASLLFAAIPETAFGGTYVNTKTDDGQISYQVRKGDTLIDLAARFFNHVQDYRIVQTQNKIADPANIPVGKVIQIPRAFLRYQAGTAKLVSVRGSVAIRDASTPAMQAKIGQILGEGDRLSTSASSFVTLQLDDGSRVSLPSNSDLTIRRLRTYTLGGSMDYDFDVGKGGARSTVTPLKTPDDRYRVRSPKAVSAVRGTDFQTRYDPDTNRDFAEVVNGALAVGLSSDASMALPAGQGLAVSADGKATVEALLPAPRFVQPGKVQSDHDLHFKAMPSASENGYRLTVASDAGFIDQVEDLRSPNPDAKISGISDGNYFLRVRAISAQGIEGIPATFAFKRRLNGVSASGGKGDDGYSFKWLGEGNGARSYHFQMFKGNKSGTAFVDEAGLDTDRISISDLTPGDYYWRVGAVQYLDNEASTNWSDFEKLTIAP